MSSKHKSSDGDWTCSDTKCNNLNFARRNSCNRCGKEREPSLDSKKNKQSIEIGKAAAEKSHGLFSADDWQCSKCGNVNWARRNTCNMCNAPKVGEVEERTGYGGGFNEREGVEYIRREESDDEFDEFGLRKKKFRGALPPPVKSAIVLEPAPPPAAAAKADNDDDDDEDDDDEDDDENVDLSKYDLWGDDDEEGENEESSKDPASMAKSKKENNSSTVNSLHKSKSRSRSNSRSHSKSSRSSRSRSYSRDSSHSSKSSSGSGRRDRSRSREAGRRKRSFDSNSSYSSKSRSRSRSRSYSKDKRMKK